MIQGWFQLLGAGGNPGTDIVEAPNFLKSIAYAYYIVNKALDFHAEGSNVDVTSLSDYSGNGRTATLTSPATIGPDNVLLTTPSPLQMVQSLDCKSGHSLIMPFDGSGFVTSTHEIWIALQITDGQPTASYTLCGARGTGAYILRVASTGVLTVEYSDPVTGQKLASTNTAYFVNGNTGYKVVRIKMDWTAKQISIYADTAINTPVALNSTNNGNLSAHTAGNYAVTNNWALGNGNASGALNDTSTNNRYITQFAVIPRALTTQEATDALALFRYQGVFLDYTTWLRFDNTSDFTALRTQMINDVYRVTNTLPTALPTDWTTHTTDTYVDYTGWTNLDHAEVANIKLHPTKAWNVKLYKFVPSTDNGRIILFPTGHGDDWAKINNDALGGRVGLGWKYFVDLGYTVLGWYMTGRGPNATDDGVTQGSAGVTHDQMGTLETGAFNPLDYFLTPSFVAINYAKSLGYNKLTMTGISGGGWTVLNACFMDTRVDFMFPVSGFFADPAYHLAAGYSEAPTGGDWEQVQLFDANNLSKIIISANNKVYREYHNDLDGCCFSGFYSRLYAESIKDVLSQIGSGDYNHVFYTVNGEHTYTTGILDDMEALITD